MIEIVLRPFRREQRGLKAPCASPQMFRTGVRTVDAEGC